jgi:hypothetical protein
VALKRALLVEAHLAEQGELKPNGDAHDLLGRQPAFMRLYLDCMKLLGLERRAVDANDLDAILRREAAAHYARAAQNAITSIRRCGSLSLDPNSITCQPTVSNDCDQFGSKRPVAQI